ncbi:MAG: hypothetical protein FJX77_12110 [Armatimonadetes bacterium]|nr:hypothetical protein [Armatimonadota bacterium]
MALLLGLDAGGTRTRAHWLDLDTGARGRGAMDGANWTVHGAAHCRARLRDATALSGLPRAPTAVAVCIAGYYPRDHAEEATAAVRGLWPRSLLVIRPDMYGAWAGALDGEPGILVVSGTGSIAFGRGRSGAEARAGGWGPLFGDAGSAYAVGLAALRYLAASADGMVGDTVLATRLPERRRHPDAPQVRLREWLRGIYRHGWDREKIAGLAPEVTAAAREGDAVALSLLEEAGHELGRLILAVQRRLGEADLPAAFSGGLAENAPEVIEVAQQFLLGEGSSITIRPPRRPAVEGTLLLAAEVAGGVPAQQRAREFLDRPR